MPKKRMMSDGPLQIVCCLVFDDQDRLLLLKRHAKAFGGGLWCIPGGKLEQNEEAATTARRETKEETNLELSDVSYLGYHELRMPHGVAHMKTYHAQVASPVDVVIDEKEHREHLWLPLGDILATESIIWGLPTTLVDFGLLEPFEADPTLADGSQAILLERAA